jgi:hypothetical protein
MLILSAFSCKKSNAKTNQQEQSSTYISVTKPDFFEEKEHAPLSAAGEKWFENGLYHLSQKDTARAKTCYLNALRCGYPVSREYLMPVGL